MLLLAYFYNPFQRILQQGLVQQLFQGSDIIIHLFDIPCIQARLCLWHLTARMPVRCSLSQRAQKALKIRRISDVVARGPSRVLARPRIQVRPSEAKRGMLRTFIDLKEVSGLRSTLKIHNLLSSSDSNVSHLDYLADAQSLCSNQISFEAFKLLYRQMSLAETEHWAQVELMLSIRAQSNAGIWPQHFVAW